MTNLVNTQLNGILMTLFLMAAGNSRRWRKYSPSKLPLNKMEVDIYGKPLIQWTFDQLKERRLRCELITKQYVGNTVSVVHSIQKTHQRWSGQCKFLLGDVVWSDAALDKVLRYSGTYMFFGNRSEIFALSFPEREYRKMLGGMTKLVNDANSEAKLRDLRYLLTQGNIIPPSNELESRCNDLHFTFVGDWTQDMDHYSSYMHFHKKLGAKEELLAR